MRFRKALHYSSKAVNESPKRSFRGKDEELDALSDVAKAAAR